MEKYANIHQAIDQNKAIDTKSQSLQQRVVMKFMNSFKRTVWNKASITCHMILYIVTSTAIHLQENQSWYLFFYNYLFTLNSLTGHRERKITVYFFVLTTVKDRMLDPGSLF